MQIYGTSSENRIYNNGAPLRITMGSGGSVIIGKTDNSTKIAEFTPDGSVDLYYDGTKKLETGQLGVSITDNLYVSYGSGGNLYLGPQTGSGGSNSEITTNHSLYIDYAKITGTSGNFNIRNKITQQFTIQGSSGRTELNQYGSGTITGTPTYNLEINSLGHILETTPSAGGGGGTAKGGTFSKLYTTGTVAAGAATAFTINRSGTGAMVFDVMLTSDTSTSCAIAKKFTVVNTFGNAIAPIFNKILDTGPDGSNDFTVVFAKDGAADSRVKCTIAAVGLDSQKVGITIDLGFGQNDATIVMNA